jgi:hypothetical protein
MLSDYEPVPKDRQVLLLGQPGDDTPPATPAELDADRQAFAEAVEVERLVAENERLRYELELYGNHKILCPTSQDATEKCICGFTEATR